MRYRATRAFRYTTTDGEDRLVHEGDFVFKASEGKLAELVADGMVKEARGKAEEDES